VVDTLVSKRFACSVEVRRRELFFEGIELSHEQKTPLPRSGVPEDETAALTSELR
jgi:hypothetical protein